MWKRYTNRVKNLPHHYVEERPWGKFERFTHNEQTTVKIITVKAGEAFSLQTHRKRDEFWRIIGGTGAVTVGDATSSAGVGDSFFIPRGSTHRAEGGGGGLVILEIAFGAFDETDIVRIEDRYGRA